MQIFHFSDGWTTDDVIFKWKHTHPVQIISNLHLPRFALEQFTTGVVEELRLFGPEFCAHFS